MDIKISSLLKKAAEETALDMIEKGVAEMDIPNMSYFHLSKAQNHTSGYHEISKIEVRREVFYIYQKI